MVDSWFSYAAAAPTIPSELGERAVFSFDAQALAGKKLQKWSGGGIRVWAGGPQGWKIIENSPKTRFLRPYSTLQVLEIIFVVLQTP